MQRSLFSKDFTLMVIGQVISLFGNAALRFALPLYLLNRTGSSALYGTVTACAFLPSILLSPVGGMVADRVNKRNIMVALDFFTSAVVIAFSLLMDQLNVIVLTAAAMMLLYGIAGAYQPAVQASIPALVDREQFMEANAVINTISSFAALIGPVFGGILYGAYGLKPVVQICAACFFASAVMELFIRIPFEAQASAGSMWSSAKKDFAQSFHFIQKDRPVIGQVLLGICGINLFLSAMLIIGVPYLITEVWELGSMQAKNQLCGFAEGALAAGGLVGGICTGVLAQRLRIQSSGNLIMISTACIVVMGAAFAVSPSGQFNYLVITVCSFLIMAVSTMFSVQMISFIQQETPPHLIGKVIAVIFTISMCAQPLGSALYGILFELCSGFEFAVVLFSGFASLAVAIGIKNVLKHC